MAAIQERNLAILSDSDVWQRSRQVGGAALNYSVLYLATIASVFLVSERILGSGFDSHLPGRTATWIPRTEGRANESTPSNLVKPMARKETVRDLQAEGDPFLAISRLLNTEPSAEQVPFPANPRVPGRGCLAWLGTTGEACCWLSNQGQNAEVPSVLAGPRDESVHFSTNEPRNRSEFAAKNRKTDAQSKIGSKIGLLGWVSSARSLSFDRVAEERPVGVISPYEWGQKTIPISGQGLSGTEVVDQAVSSAMRSHGIVGCSIAVLRGQDVLYAKGFGFAELPSEPFLPTTTARCGSVAKPITALCAMLLMDLGRLRRDELVLPILRSAGYKITPIDPRMERIRVRDLMDHTSGIPTGATYTSWRPGTDLIAILKLKQRPTPKDVVEHAWSTSKLAFEPGTERLYSNAGFVTLGRVIEIKAGMPFGDYLAKVAMPRFGVREGGIHVSRDQVSPEDPARGKREAAYYQTSTERYGSFVPEDGPRGAVFGEAYRGMSSECSDGAGGIATSAAGLAQLLSTLQSVSSPLSETSIRELLTPPGHYQQLPGFDPSRSEFGSQGFLVRFSGGRPWLSHGGMTNHCGAAIGHNAGYQFVVISNWQAPSAPYVDAILDRALAGAVANIR